jgi:glycosyltransferase involved in cell wall biosynthesis
VGGNPELIQHGRNGLLVRAFDDKEFARAIISLLKDEHSNNLIGKEARRTVETSFSSTKCAENTYNVYKKTLSELR